MTDIAAIDREVEIARHTLETLKHRIQPNLGGRRGVTHDLSIEDLRGLAAAEKHLEVALRLQQTAERK